MNYFIILLFINDTEKINLRIYKKIIINGQGSNKNITLMFFFIF